GQELGRRMRAMVVLVEPDGAARPEPGGRERQGEATVVGDPQVLVHEWREAPDDDERPRALARHRRERAPAVAHHRGPAIAEREDSAAIDGDLARAGRGRDHRARVEATWAQTVPKAETVGPEHRRFGEAQVRSDDEGAAALKERPHGDGV